MTEFLTTTRRITMQNKWSLIRIFTFKCKIWGESHTNLSMIQKWLKVGNMAIPNKIKVPTTSTLTGLSVRGK